MIDTGSGCGFLVGITPITSPIRDPQSKIRNLILQVV
jgi:hypothetical protein